MLYPASPHVAAGPDPTGVLLMDHTAQIRAGCGQMCPVLEAKLFNLPPLPSPHSPLGETSWPLLEVSAPAPGKHVHHGQFQAATELSLGRE